MAPSDDTPGTGPNRQDITLVVFVPSLIIALLVWSVSFGGRPSLGRFIVVPYSLHFLIMDLMVLRGILKVLDIFL